VYKLLALDVEVERDLLCLGQVGLVRVGKGPAGLDVADLGLVVGGWWGEGRREREKERVSFFLSLLSL